MDSSQKTKTDFSGDRNQLLALLGSGFGSCMNYKISSKFQEMKCFYPGKKLLSRKAVDLYRILGRKRSTDIRIHRRDYPIGSK